MFKLNEDSLEIEITEILSFDNHIKPKLDEIADDLSQELDESDYDFSDDNEEQNQEEFDSDEDKLRNIKHFIDDYNNDNISHDEYKDLLETVYSHWEYVTCDGFDNRSVFDEDIIKEGIYEWLENNYDIAQ